MSKLTETNKPSINDLAYRSIATVLDSLDALVYVSDMQSYELLYINDYGRRIWGDIQGKTCWQVLQENQPGPCPFCTNNRLLNDSGEPSGVYVWEFQNTINKRWYQCRDQAITWVDGRIVRMEVATDITDRKQAEGELQAAKERAEQLAHLDDLTGLNNRRAFFDIGSRAIKQAFRYQHPVAVVMMDIDHFKNINDNYGHSVGDTVLVNIAIAINKTVRAIDISARIGGEEFAFILPETNVDEASQLAERLRSNIQNMSMEHEGSILQLTASFGISVSNEIEQSLESMLTQADDALYIAKKKGRNQVKVCH